MSFEDVVVLDFRNMKESGLIPYWDIEKQTMDISIFESFVGSKEEDYAFQIYLKNHIPMGSGSHSLVSRGMYELQLRPWIRAFPNDGAFLVLKLEDMKDEGVAETMKKVYEHLKLPYHKVEDDSAKNTRSYDEMKPETKELLQRFYAPHNARLEGLLKSHGWKNTWR